jgi:hypothetical protein
MVVLLSASLEELPGLLRLLALKYVHNGLVGNTIALWLELNAAFPNGQLLILLCSNVDLTRPIGLFLVFQYFKILVILVELIGILSPPPAIGRLRSAVLRMPAALTLAMAARPATLRRAPTVFAPSGV